MLVLPEMTDFYMLFLKYKINSKSKSKLQHAFFQHYLMTFTSYHNHNPKNYLPLIKSIK